MTREESIYKLEQTKRYSKYLSDDEIAAIGMAIKALEQEPCDDCVSRAKVEEITWDVPIYADAFNVLVAVRDKVRALPSVTPQPCGDVVSRQAVDELSKSLVHTTKNKADFLCNFWEGLQKLPSVSPQQKVGRWILADEQNKEDVENDNYRFICSECQCSDIHAKGIKVPYCWKCGTKMED